MTVLIRIGVRRLNGILGIFVFIAEFKQAIYIDFAGLVLIANCYLDISFHVYFLKSIEQPTARKSWQRESMVGELCISYSDLSN